jgi:hypothetical protein
MYSASFHFRNALAQIVCAHDWHDFHCRMQVRKLWFDNLDNL